MVLWHPLLPEGCDPMVRKTWAPTQRAAAASTGRRAIPQRSSSILQLHIARVTGNGHDQVAELCKRARDGKAKKCKTVCRMALEKNPAQVVEAPETDPELQAAELGTKGYRSLAWPPTVKVERKAGTPWLLLHGALSAPRLGNTVDTSCLPDKPFYELPSKVCESVIQHSLPEVVCL